MEEDTRLGDLLDMVFDVEVEKEDLGHVPLARSIRGVKDDDWLLCSHGGHCSTGRCFGATLTRGNPKSTVP